MHPHSVLNGLSLGSSGVHAYFLHSFHLVPADEKDLVATAEYGGRVSAIIARDNILGMQFHPEKSQVLGLGLLCNFLRWTP
jgi:glutamine amidotransferase